MNRKTKILALIFIVLTILISFLGCKKEDEKNYTKLIRLEVKEVSKQELPEGISYSLKLKYRCAYTIKQNNVYLYFPIIENDGNSQSYNPLKIEAKGNKLNIKPNEEVVLTFFIPEESITHQVKNIEPKLEIKAYIKEVKEENYFHSMGISLYN